ncbi:MAG: PilZ domain-containing protein [Bacillota bacterium]
MERDRRKENRASTHIVTEIAIEGQFPKCYGYIENLSKDGMGVISLDNFNPGEKVISSFYLIPDQISPKASLVHTQKGDCNLYYYGFKFDSLTENESQAIDRYLRENNHLIQPA